MMEIPEIMSVIKERVDCRDVVSNILGINVERRKYAGQTAILCLNHNDTHLGSCFVKKDYVHCFACGWHADAVGIVMKGKECTWTEAVKTLDEYYGLGLDLTKDKEAYKPENTIRLNAAELQLIGIRDREKLRRLFEEDREQFWSYLAACIDYTDKMYSITDCEACPSEVRTLLNDSSKTFLEMIKNLEKLKKKDKPESKLIIFRE